MANRKPGARDFQEDLLDRLLERGQITTIYLNNRMSLRGRILEFDPYVLLLEPLDGSPPQMVYKSAVVSVCGPRQVRPGPGPRGGDRPRPPRPYPDREHGEERPPRRDHDRHSDYPGPGTR